MDIRGHRVVRPAGVEDVVALVRAANAGGERLYPVSTGLNWGYGPAVPTDPDVVVVDLSAMDRIRNAGRISPRHPVAVIEPGVTQGALADFLAREQPQLALNVTGSARATSIIGNALDGGIGYRGPRREDLSGFEVVTGSGEVLRTGFRRLGEDSPLAEQGPAGLGPALDGLLVQGSLGIVTSACFRLEIRQPCEAGLSLSLRDGASLAALYDALLRLRREQVLGQVIHVGNRARTRATLLPAIERHLAGAGLAPGRVVDEARDALDGGLGGDWSGMVGVSGTRAQVDAAFAEVRRRLRGIGHARLLTSARLRAAGRLAHALRAWPRARRMAAVLEAVRPLHGLMLGQPTDAPVRALLDSFGEHGVAPVDLARSRVGLIYISPALPDDGVFVERFVARMADCARGFGQDLQVTLNIESAHAAAAIASIVFDRSDPLQESGAEACAHALLDLVYAEGLELYRAPGALMPRIVERDPAHWARLAKLRASLDPNGVIATGWLLPH